MKCRFFLMVVLWVTLSACSKEKTRELPILIQNENSCKPILLTTQTRLEGDYRLLYIGKPLDTITIIESISSPPSPVKVNQKIIFNEPFYAFGNYRAERYPNFEYEIPQRLSIIIDTSQVISRFYPSYEMYCCFENFPVFIRNVDTKSVDITINDRVLLIIEALNSNGEWVSIDEKFFVECGAGVDTYLLHPNNICVTSIPRYDGNFVTQMRVKIGSNISNSVPTCIRKELFL